MTNSQMVRAKSLDQVYAGVLRNMEETVHRLASQVPPPQYIPTKSSFVFRYGEKSIHQAVIQKLARMVSTLHAARLLSNRGFFQEVGSHQRILDEIQDDILFLVSGFERPTPLHEGYLDAFFEEEFDADDPLSSTQRRPMVPRQKIRAHNARLIAAIPGSPVDPSRTAEVLRTIDKAYSGYIHLASPQTMEMFGGNPPRFHMGGIKGTGAGKAQRRDLWNYFCRGIFAFGIATRAFGDDDSADKIRDYARWFEQNSKPNS